MKKTLCVWISCFMFLLKASAQCTPCNDPGFPVPDGVIDFNQARISIIAGGNIEFNFGNIQQYSSGLSLTNATILGITICDCPSEGGGSADPVANSTLDGWELYFDTDDANFTGQDPANTLPLCILEAEATPRVGMVGVNFNGRQPLGVQPTTAMPLADESTVLPATPSRVWTTDQMFITYFCGVPPTNADCLAAGQNFPFINDPPLADYYTATVSFTLVPLFSGGISYDPFY
jgi:hypothetical protein